MLKDNVLVRKLTGIETAGNINILFTDKTGTLTKGELEVVKYVAGDLKEYSYFELIKTKLSQIVKISCTINNASVYSSEKIVGGNITDKAILKFIKQNNLNYFKEKVIPFDSKKKYSGIIIEEEGCITIREANAKYEKDMRPIEEGCQCPACQKYSRAYIRHLLKAKEMLGMRLCVLHNLYFYNHLMEEIRDAISEHRYAEFKKATLEGFLINDKK